MVRQRRGAAPRGRRSPLATSSSDELGMALIDREPPHPGRRPSRNNLHMPPPSCSSPGLASEPVVLTTSVPTPALRSCLGRLPLDATIDLDEILQRCQTTTTAP